MIKTSLVVAFLRDICIFISGFWMMMQLRKEIASQSGPPGYDPSLDAKPKTKSVKRNERKKEKRLQVCHIVSLCHGFSMYGLR